MRLKQAAGLVVYRKVGEKIEYLLLKASYGKHEWSPPKGHLDKGETEWMAALRETKEEANLNSDQYIVHEDCHETTSYEARNCKKTVKFWAAMLKDSEEVRVSKEHLTFQWFELNDAIKAMNYEEMEMIFRKFHDYILQH